MSPLSLGSVSQDPFGPTVLFLDDIGRAQLRDRAPVGDPGVLRPVDALSEDVISALDPTGATGIVVAALAPREAPKREDQMTFDECLSLALTEGTRRAVDPVLRDIVRRLVDDHSLVRIQSLALFEG